MTHRDGFPRLSARSAWRSDAGHRKPCAPSESYGPSESLGKSPSVAQANRRRASESLDDVPHRPRLPSYPADRLRDLYESLSALLGMTPAVLGMMRIGVRTAPGDVPAPEIRLRSPARAGVYRVFGFQRRTRRSAFSIWAAVIAAATFSRFLKALSRYSPAG